MSHPSARTRSRSFGRTLVLAVAGLLGNLTPPGQAAEPTTARAPIRLLIVTGVDYPGHPWRETTPVLRRHFEADPRFEVRVLEDPLWLDSAALTNYQVIALHFMNWECPSPGPAARQNLRRFVENGGGLVLVHFACGAWQDWPEFVELAGRVWDPKLRGHDPRGRFTVTPTAREHPITRGLTAFEVDDELYTCLAGETPITVLATARSTVDSQEYPMALVLEVGRGRVFHSPLGHDARALEPAAVGALFRRGAAWAAGR